MPSNFLQEVCHMFSWLFALVGQSVFHFAGMCRWPQAFWVISHQAFWYFALIIKKKKVFLFMTHKPGTPLKRCFFIFDSASLEIPSILSFTSTNTSNRWSYELNMSWTASGSFCHVSKHKMAKSHSDTTHTSRNKNQPSFFTWSVDKVSHWLVYQQNPDQTFFSRTTLSLLTSTNQ